LDASSPLRQPIGYLEFEKKQGRDWDEALTSTQEKLHQPSVSFVDYLPNSIVRKMRRSHLSQVSRDTNYYSLNTSKDMAIPEFNLH
jgi:hypothetical protein